MVNSSEKFLIDANTLMTASRFFYAYDLVPSFWETFEDEIKAGNIVLLDMVKAEIDKGEDELKQWSLKEKMILKSVIMLIRKSSLNLRK